MIWVDWLIVAVIIISALLSLQRGFVKEALSLATWVIAFFVARWFADSLAVLLDNYIKTPSLRFAAAFIILFVSTLIVGALINNLIVSLIRLTGLSSIDRLLGVVFGAARGVILVVIAVGILSWMSIVIQDLWWRQSVLIPHFLLIEEWARKLVIDYHQSPESVKTLGSFLEHLQKG